MKRRTFIAGATAFAAAGVGAAVLSRRGQTRPVDLSTMPRLQMPELLDTTTSGRLELTALNGTTRFFRQADTKTLGFNQPYLGPVVRLRNGALDVSVQNNLGFPITSHWHGLMVPGEHDGGPHSAIPAGGRWRPDMEVSQRPTTAFYHTHVHGRTAPDVYAGLAGVMHLTDGRDEDRGLPTTYGVDDLTLILQDRRFDRAGRMIYNFSMMDRMHGFLGDTMLINGQIGAVAAVPKGIVRLRLVNASNARTYSLFADDNRPLHLIATDGGFIPAPTAVSALRLSPGERAEVLVDFSNGQDMYLMSAGDPNVGPVGMMGRLRGLADTFVDRSYSVIPLAVDDTLPTRFIQLPGDLGGDEPNLSGRETRTRYITLDMGMGGMMGGGMMGERGMGGGRGMMGGFAINGKPFDMNRIDIEIERGAIERWIMSSDMLTHPFHIHGASFQVASENGRAPRPESRGWKDTVLIDGESELLVRFDHPADRQTPYMYHCHILEHEDAGMMGQLTVS